MKLDWLAADQIRRRRMNVRIRISLVAVTLLITILACNLPDRLSAPTPSEPTPNRTMTALFSIITQQSTMAPPVATATPDPQVPTATESISLPSPTTALTPLPTATVTLTRVAELRPAGRASAAFLATPPVMDGVWDEWETTGYPARHVVYGRENHTGSDDLEGSFRIGWDNTYLYLAVKVIDDKYVQNATGIDIFKGDSIELLMDTDLLGDLNSTELNQDDYQLIISPGRGGTDGPKEAYLYYPTVKAGPRTDVVIASEGGDGLYRVEVAIPWSLFNITPAAGQQYGFAVSVSDNDNPGANVQESMVSNVQNRSLTNPTSWALLTLTR
jgi:hypothetical protein